MEKLIAETIGKIKKENIKPEPRWRYLAKKYSAWLSFFAIALVGAAALSTAYFLVSQLDWDLYPATHRRPVFYFLSLLPYLWIILLMILAFLAFFNLRKTENGYRYNFSKIALSVLGCLFVFGLLMVFSGFGEKINGTMARGFPGYGKLVTTKEAQWSQPEKGLLAGTIKSISEKSIDLEDLEGKEWQVAYGGETIICPSVNLESGKMIKAIGREESSQTFQANEIRPWQGKGKMKKGGGEENRNSNTPGKSGGAMNGLQK